MARQEDSRREFLKKGAAGIAAITVLPGAVRAAQEGAEPPAEKPAEKQPERKVIHRTLGKTGIKLPIVSMGARFGTPEQIRAALDAGIVHIDTANSYGNGRHEEAVGEAIKGRPRDSFVIGTKVYMNIDQQDRPVPRGRHARAVPGEVRDQHGAAGPGLRGHPLPPRRGQGRVGHLRALPVGDEEAQGGRADPVHRRLDAHQRAGGDQRRRGQQGLRRGAHRLQLPAAPSRGTGGGHRPSGQGRSGHGGDEDPGRRVLGPGAHAADQHEGGAEVGAEQPATSHTTIPGFASFEEMEVALSVMEDLALTAGGAQGPQARRHREAGRPVLPPVRRLPGPVRPGPGHPDADAQLHVRLRLPGPGQGQERRAEHRPVAGALRRLRRLPGHELPHGLRRRSKVRDIARIRQVPDDFIA